MKISLHFLRTKHGKLSFKLNRKKKKQITPFKFSVSGFSPTNFENLKIKTLNHIKLKINNIIPLRYV